MNNRVFELHAEQQRVLGIHGAGLVFGLLLGGLHFLWALLVASGFAQRVIDLVFWLHFIRPAWQIDSFEAGRAAGLVAMTSAIGYVIGAALAFLWRRLQPPIL